MKKILFFVLAILTIVSCSDDSEPSISGPFKDIKLKVNFGDSKKALSSTKDDTPLTEEIPMNYFIALKSLTLKGADGTADYEVFNSSSLANSEIYEFEDNTPLSVLQEEDIPEGTFSAVELEIYYLQMRITIALDNPGDREAVEHRNFRIYMSDDAAYEQGTHQPGDMTQINDGVGEIGWLLGEGQEPNMDPVTPRSSAYTYNADGTSWYDFAEKSAENYGPFGSVNFWSSAPQPIYSQLIDFSFENAEGNTMIIEFDVTGCWKFQDKDGNGSFGFGDLDPLDPTEWEMDLPGISVSYQ